MRLFLGLSVVILALAAWLAFGSRREMSAPVETASAAAEPRSLSSADLVSVASRAASTPASEPISPPSEEKETQPLCRVFGRVVDTGGSAVSNARVTLYLSGQKSEEEERLEFVTKSDGRFLIETFLLRKDARLLVHASDFLSIGQRDFGFGQEQKTLVMGDNDVGDIRLRVCGAIAGRVVDEAGLPVAAVRVTSNSGDDWASVVTDPDGRYRMIRFGAGRYAIVVETEEWSAPGKLVVDVAEMQVTDAPDIVVQRTPTISGVVVAESGAPAAKLVIQARTKDKSAHASAKSAADGSFTLYLPKPEPFTLEIKSSGEFASWSGVPGDPRFTFAPGTSGVRIVLARAPAVTLRVIDAATRAPIERFGIRVAQRDPPNVTTSKHMPDLAVDDHPRGEARLPVLGEPVIAVTAPSYADLEVPFALDPGSTEVQTIAMPRASGVTGRARLDRKPVARAAVQLHRDSFNVDRVPSEAAGVLGKNMLSDVARFPGRLRTTETDEAGLFHFTSLAPGTYAVSIETRGSGQKWLRMLVVPPEDILNLGDVDLDAEAIVRGVVITGPNESPIGFELQGDGRSVAIQSADGQFEFRGLSAGPFSFYWHRPNANMGTWDGDAKRYEFELQAGETREVVIDASQSAPCTLRVRVRKGGQPAANIAVSARIESHEWRSRFVGMTDALGLAVGRVEGGTRARVEALSAAKRPVGRTALPIDTIAGGDVSCSIDIAVGTLTVELPATLTRPENGLVMLLFDGDTVGVASTGPARGDGQPIWSTNTIEFGEVAAGSHNAELKFQRFERDPAYDNPKIGNWVSLRDAFKTRIEIKEGEATRVVVP